MKDLQATLQAGATFIADQQLTDGTFASLSSSSPHDFTHAQTLPAIFATSTILAALHMVQLSELDSVKHSAATFLWQQKSADWSFNYWRRDSEHTHTQPYPDDLDDTFCALAALWLHDRALLSGKALAGIAQLLIATEKRPGGPYRTWLTDTKTGGKWGDIDLAVNANVGWFLSLQDVQVPGITRLIERAIVHDAFASPYYPSKTMPLYFITRWYRGKQQTKLLATVQTRLVAIRPNDSLGIAMLVSSSLRLGIKTTTCKPYINLLLEAQQKNSSWSAAAFCLDPAIGSTAYYAGSPTLTTAFCLEALALYDQAIKTTKPSGQDTSYQQVVAGAKQSVNAIRPPELRRSVHTALQRVLHSGNQQQIVLLPYMIAEAAGVSVPARTLEQLAVANVWGWAAYTVCDDFLDNESTPALLPGAITTLRYLHTTLAGAMPDNRAFQQEVQAILEQTDAANAWEIDHCRGEFREGRLYIKRLPNYGNHWQLADRALGHTIAGLGVLYAAGFDSNAPELIALRTFFRHYLIARQLNDDAHDWEDDLRYGHINATGVLVLKHWLVASNGKLADGIPLDSARETLQSSMWECVIDMVSKQIFRHTAAARQATFHSDFDVTPFEAMLAPLDTAAREALTTRQRTRDFLANL